MYFRAGIVSDYLAFENDLTVAIKITRRDLLNGMVIGVGGALVKAYAGPTSQKLSLPLTCLLNYSLQLRIIHRF